MSNAMRVGIFLALLLLLPLAQGQSCTSVPANGCDLTHDVTLTPGTYFLPNGMDATTDNVRLNCNGGTIRGSNVEGEHGVLGVFRTNVTVRNCRFEDFNPPSFGSGVFFAQSHFITVQDSIFEDTAFGISINGTVANDHIVIEDNLFIRTRRDNLLLKANFSVARGNTFLLSTEENALHTDGAHNLIEDNVFDSPNTQLLSFQIQNITVRRNSFRGTGETTTAAVLFLPFAGGTFEDITFVDNRVEDAYVTFGDYSSPGITHNGLTVSRNTFKDVGWVQVDFWDGSVISHNNGTRLVFGIQFAGGRDHLVQGNRLTGPGCTDFTDAPPPFGTNPTCNRINVIVLSAPVATEDLTVQHNRMSDAQLGSFVVGDGGPGGLTDATILNNTITNSRGGMILQDGSGLAIEENHVDAEINDMHLTSSTVQGNTFAGDQFNVSGSGSTFTDNTFDGIAVADTGAGHIWCVGTTGNSYLNGASYTGPDTAAGTCPENDLEVLAIMPLQTVENVSLIRDKRGKIRTLVRWNSITFSSVSTTLTYKLIPTGPSSPITLGQMSVTLQKNLDTPIVFNFTPSVSEGSYLVSVEANRTLSESNVGNNIKSVLADVVDTDPLRIAYVPVGYSPFNLQGFRDAVRDQHQFLTTVYPLGVNDAPSSLVGIPYIPQPGQLIPIVGTLDLLRGVYLHAVLFSGRLPDRVSGIFPPFFRTFWEGGYSTWPPLPAVIASDSERMNTAHEIGHTFELCDEYGTLLWGKQDTVRRFFSGTGCPNGDREPPTGLDPICVSGPGCPQMTLSGLVPWVPNGFPEFAEFLNLMGEESSPHRRWIDRPSYLHLIEVFQSPIHQNVSSRILVSGFINMTGSGMTGSFEPLMDLSPGEIIEDTEALGGFTLDLLDAQGNLLDNVTLAIPFSISFIGGDTTESNVSLFLSVLERPPDLAAIRILDNGTEIGRITRSDNAPSVEIISPQPGTVYRQNVFINWDASDPDGDSLTYAIGVSDDGGVNWHTLIAEYPNTSIEFDINTTLLDITDDFLIRILVSDGFLSGEDIMEVTFAINLSCEDADDDFVCDISDNCVNDSNPSQKDFGRDGSGDICDLDDDDDGVLDENDRCPFSVLPEQVPTQRLLPSHFADIDGDGWFESVKGKRLIEDVLHFNVTHGCSCSEILDFKPGQNEGEIMHGCTGGTLRAFG